MTGNLIAFDIGAAQAKLVWYSGSTRKKAVAVSLPDRLVENGQILSMDAMADFLRASARKNGIPKGKAAVILPSSLVFSRNVEVPVMTDAQLSYNLPFEFKEYLTQEKSQYYFDYSVQELCRDENGTVTKLKLFACAALKKTIADYREMLHRAGFRLCCAIPEESAYAALLTEHLARNGEEATDYCLVDLGDNAIRMHILHGDRIVTWRTMDLGIRDLIACIAESRGVDEHMAREYLLRDYEGAQSDPVCQELYHRMAVEIMKAVNFYNYNNREQTLQRIYLCGGGTAIRNISDAITELTSLEICPAAQLMPDTDGLDHPWLFAKAIGCAMQAGR